MKLTKQEQKAIIALKKIAEAWPSTLWLYSASGSLCVMTHDRNGNRALTLGGGYNQDYVIDTIDIPNDGGDW